MAIRIDDLRQAFETSRYRSDLAGSSSEIRLRVSLIDDAHQWWHADRPVQNKDFVDIVGSTCGSWRLEHIEFAPSPGPTDFRIEVQGLNEIIEKCHRYFWIGPEWIDDWLMPVHRPDWPGTAVRSAVKRAQVIGHREWFRMDPQPGWSKIPSAKGTAFFAEPIAHRNRHALAVMPTDFSGMLIIEDSIAELVTALQEHRDRFGIAHRLLVRQGTQALPELLEPLKDLRPRFGRFHTVSPLIELGPEAVAGIPIYQNLLYCQGLEHAAGDRREAALLLESIGVKSLPVLFEAMRHPIAEVREYAEVALEGLCRRDRHRQAMLDFYANLKANPGADDDIVGKLHSLLNLF